MRARSSRFPGRFRLGPPTVAEIRLSALRHNVHAIRALLPQGVGLLGIVKANAYGTARYPWRGPSRRMGRGCWAWPRWRKGWSCARGGSAFPSSSWGRRPAAGGGGPRPRSFGGRVRPGADRLSHPRGGDGRASFPVHLKVDTGMGRLGLLPREAMEAASLLASTPALRMEGWMTHLSSADGPAAEDREYTAAQLATFRGMLPAVRKAFGPAWRSTR